LIRVKPTSDIFIKYLFGKEEHKPLLLDFINAVQKNADFPLIRDLVIKNPFNIKTTVMEKETILDIKAVAENGQTYNIEVQTTGNGVFKHRSLYYWARLYQSQLDEGNRYDKLCPVICINILDFTLFGLKDKFHLYFMLREMTDPSLILTNHLVIHYLELPGFTDYGMNKELDQWMYYLKYEGGMEENMTLKTLFEDNPRLAEAHEKYLSFTQDEELRDAYEARMKWIRDYNSGMYAAREEGRQSMILRLLTKRFGSIVLAPEYQERLRNSTSEQLDSWAEKLLDAKSIEDVFN
jgi:predicted transposase/invertase (TIGR01784 family)